jgi:hypothetical protein
VQSKKRDPFFPMSQPPQLPPQSTSVSPPFITRSEHEARTQWQLMHTFEAQPEGAAHPALAAGAVVAKSPLLVADALRAAIGDAIGVRVADLFLDTIIEPQPSPSVH